MCIRDSVKPGSDVTIPPDTLVYIPLGASLVLPEDAQDEDGNFTPGLQPGRGLTVGNGFYIPEEYSFTAPEPEPLSVDGQQVDGLGEVDGLSYPVIMELDEIDVTKTGVSFNAGDTITVSGGGLPNGQSFTFEPILSTLSLIHI